MFLAVAAYQQLADVCDYPLHIGVTEAGGLRSGTVKSSIGMGSLLWAGIGDTIRVSLSADPVEEIRVGFDMLKALGLRHRGVNVISCPSCARQQFDVIETVRVLEERLAHITTPMTLSVIGCVVNGPGEALMTDIGFTGGGRGTHQVYVKGQPSHRLQNEDIVAHLVSELVEDKAAEIEKAKSQAAGLATASTTDAATLSVEKGSWLDVVRAIWHFLGKNKKKYVFFNSVLFLVFFYELIPPYIVGRVVDFFSHYTEGSPLTVFYFYAAFLGVSHIVISIIRLSTKMTLTRISIAAKTAARVTGFDRLMDFSLQWHARENSGNKMQRIFTGSDSIPEWAFLVANSIFPVATSFIGVLGFFLFRDPVFTLFLLVYMTLFFTIENIFNRKLKALSNTVNQHREKSSGKYIEGTGNILAIKALGAEKDIHLRMSSSEEDFKNIQIDMANTGTNKWYCFQTVSGIATGVFLLLVGRRQYLGHSISIGDILVFFTYFWKLREATNNATDISAKVIQLRSDLLRMMPIFLENMPVKTGTDDFPAQWDAIPSGMDILNILRVRRASRVSTFPLKKAKRSVSPGRRAAANRRS